MRYTHIPENHLVMRKKEALPSVTTLMKLKGIMQSEISQIEKDKYCMISLICGIKKRWIQKTDSRMVVTKGWGSRGQGQGAVLYGDIDQIVQISSYKVNKFWESNIQHGYYC